MATTGHLIFGNNTREKGVEVSVLDQPAKGLTIEETVKWVEKKDPDILGFSTLSNSGQTAALISNEVRKKNPYIINVLGGYYATFNGDRVLRKYSSVDIIVRGEGEKTVVDIVDAHLNGQHPTCSRICGR